MALLSETQRETLEMWLPNVLGTGAFSGYLGARGMIHDWRVALRSLDSGGAFPSDEALLKVVAPIVEADSNFKAILDNYGTIKRKWYPFLADLLARLLIDEN